MMNEELEIYSNGELGMMNYENRQCYCREVKEFCT